MNNLISSNVCKVNIKLIKNHFTMCGAILCQNNVLSFTTLYSKT